MKKTLSRFEIMSRRNAKSTRIGTSELTNFFFYLNNIIWKNIQFFFKNSLPETLTKSNLIQNECTIFLIFFFVSLLPSNLFKIHASNPFFLANFINVWLPEQLYRIEPHTPGNMKQIFINTQRLIHTYIH